MNMSPRNLRRDFRDKEYAYAYIEEFSNAFVATQIKTLREHLIGKQEVLAALTDMKQERISVLENVNYSSWSIKTLRKIAKALDLYLRVSFENFSTAINDIENFNNESLLRTPRERELSPPPQTTQGSGKIVESPSFGNRIRAISGEFGQKPAIPEKQNESPKKMAVG